MDRRHLLSIADQLRAIAAAGAVVLLISHDDDLLALAADAQVALLPLEEASGPARPGLTPMPAHP
ncbi:hypothetical protein [Micropruina sonneratiae]|uniref:hypothetical protein n=1 Tax=Micropruina sonneratiae TaxID=2986940 RepID=UPI0022279A28|nr:hypothetical protein [Micropruina sp. KQZ13P-5]MCW3156822.1 hypothetical protein [Micropruina sp. KQZ13P-5]